MITALAGGVGAARLLAGMAQVVEPGDLTIVANTGDDTVIHGLHVSPDVDTLIYTLAGASNPETGWGLAGETWAAMAALERLGGDTWFRLGDSDIGTHLFRTGRLTRGDTLSSVTSDIALSFGLAQRILPMSDDPVRTVIRLAPQVADAAEVPPPGEVPFQDYFVRLRHEVPLVGVRFEGAESASPAPGVLEAIESADTIVICPSNPVVSIGPILSVPGVADAVASRRDRTIAVSPIVAGRALKGPADRMLSELGHDPTVVGVARIYAPYARALVVDRVDAQLAQAVEDGGLRCIVTDTVMDTPDIAVELSRVVLAYAG